MAEYTYKQLIHVNINPPGQGGQSVDAAYFTPDNLKYEHYIVRIIVARANVYVNYVGDDGQPKSIQSGKGVLCPWGNSTIKVSKAQGGSSDTSPVEFEVIGAERPQTQQNQQQKPQLAPSTLSYSPERPTTGTPITLVATNSNPSYVKHVVSIISKSEGITDQLTVAADGSTIQLPHTIFDKYTSSGTIQIRLATYDKDTNAYIGYNDSPLIPISLSTVAAKPTLSQATITTIRSTNTPDALSELNKSVLIQSIRGGAIVFSGATAREGADIAKYIITGSISGKATRDEQSGTYKLSTASFQNAGWQNINVQAEDSRGL